MTTFVIPDETTLVNGDVSPYDTHEPGDIFVLKDTRSTYCKFINIVGTSGENCQIIPSGVQVLMSDTGYTQDAALYLEECTCTTVDGSVLPEEDYGILCSGAWRGVFGVACKSITIKAVETAYTGIQGIYIATQDGYNSEYYRSSWTMGDCVLEDNYVHHTGESSSACGMYLGRTQYEDPKFDTLIIKNNKVEESTTEAIQVRCSTETHVHDNEVIRSAVDYVPGDRNGIYLDRESGLCYVYNNIVTEGGWSGIGVYEDESGAIKYIYNNIIIDAGYYGSAGYGLWWSPVTSSDDPDLYFYNNTIVNSKTNGVFLSAGTGTVEVHDNIIVGSGSSDINNNDTGSYVQDNQTGAIASQKFRDADNDDYHLTIASPARNNSSERKVLIFDFDNVTRPQKVVADQGAYEYFMPKRRILVGYRR